MSFVRINSGGSRIFEGGFCYTFACEILEAIAHFRLKLRPFSIVFESNYQPNQSNQ